MFFYKLIRDFPPPDRDGKGDQVPGCRGGAAEAGVPRAGRVQLLEEGQVRHKEVGHQESQVCKQVTCRIKTLSPSVCLVSFLVGEGLNFF